MLTNIRLRLEALIGHRPSEAQNVSHTLLQKLASSRFMSADKSFNLSKSSKLTGHHEDYHLVRASSWINESHAGAGGLCSHHSN